MELNNAGSKGSGGCNVRIVSSENFVSLEPGSNLLIEANGLWASINLCSFRYFIHLLSPFRYHTSTYSQPICLLLIFLHLTPK